MRALHRFRKFIVLAAMVWLPMSVFAQVCATSAYMGRLAGALGPAMVAAADASPSSAFATPLLAVNIDSADCGCDRQAICEFAALSVLAPDVMRMAAVKPAPLVPLRHFHAFSTRSPVPDTPPPRRGLLI